jgi:hypothetical protein
MSQPRLRPQEPLKKRVDLKRNSVVNAHVDSSRRFSFVALIIAIVLLPCTLPAATLVKSEGTATVILNKDQTDAASLVNQTLPPGTIITTSEDGQVAINLSLGIGFTMQPSTQVTIEETKENGAVDSLGNPMPELNITLSVGTIILRTTAEGLGIAYTADGELVGQTKDGPSTAGFSKEVSNLSGYSKEGVSPTGGRGLVVRTPRGNISPVLPGEAVITVTGSDPNTATVTVQADVGSMVATDTEGRTIPVPEGLIVVLRPGLNFPPPPGNVPTVNQPSALPTPRPTPRTTPVPGPISP